MCVPLLHFLTRWLSLISQEVELSDRCVTQFHCNYNGFCPRRGQWSSTGGHCICRAFFWVLILIDWILWVWRSCKCRHSIDKWRSNTPKFLIVMRLEIVFSDCLSTWPIALTVSDFFYCDLFKSYDTNFFKHNWKAKEAKRIKIFYNF